jgi:hypothetical protein
MTELGFAKCEPLASNLDDLRDAMVSHRFTRNRSAVDIHFSFLTFQIQVVVLEFKAAATCDQRQKHTSVIDLEAWLREHGTPESKLSWMRKGTLWEEMMRSYRAYAKNVERDMEAAVDMLALRLRGSSLLESSGLT